MSPASYRTAPPRVARSCSNRGRCGIPGADSSRPPTRSRAGRTGVRGLKAIPEAVGGGQHIRAQAAADRSNLSETSADGSDRTLPIPKDSILRTPSAARSSRQTCSTSRPVGLARPVVAGQFMRLSASNGRAERRSDDGQMILRAARADQKLRFDLLFCGAPLRNRTVDLLLTMETLCRLS
jgi:hypothetical protein